MPVERLQKLIARSGICSRRDAEDLIREGRVRVNGEVAVLGAKADPEVDSVKVDGNRLKAPEPLRYVLLYKPREVMTTCDDPEKRETVLDLLKSLVPERVFPVGRLDYHSEGLLLLTNDGELAARVTHPRYGLLREYLVKVRGEIGEGDLVKILKGTLIEGRHVKPVDVVRSGSTRSGSNTWWRVRVAEGRTHEVRELFFRAGHHVQRLRRSAIGPLRDDSLRPGEFRDLNAAELKALRSATSTRRTGSREAAPSLGHSGRRGYEEAPAPAPPRAAGARAPRGQVPAATGDPRSRGGGDRSGRERSDGERAPRFQVRAADKDGPSRRGEGRFGREESDGARPARGPRAGADAPRGGPGARRDGPRSVGRGGPPSTPAPGGGPRRTAGDRPAKGPRFDADTPPRGRGAGPRSEGDTAPRGRGAGGVGPRSTGTGGAASSTPRSSTPGRPEAGRSGRDSGGRGARRPSSSVEDDRRGPGRRPSGPPSKPGKKTAGAGRSSAGPARAKTRTGAGGAPGKKRK